MRKVAIIGAGRIGRAINQMLPLCGYQREHITLYDNSNDAFIHDKQIKNLDATNRTWLEEVLADHFLVICAAPYQVGVAVAEAAAHVDCHYIDMTEDIYVASKIKEINNSYPDNKSSFIPQSGLAPGFVNIVGNHLLKNFDHPISLKMRVGALPQVSLGGLRYDCTWSPDGLINEYKNICDVIAGGSRTITEPLDGLELLTIHGVEYEAFNTSGGAGDIHNIHYNDIRELNYKTLRYPGHRNLMLILMQELKIPDNVLVEAFRNLPIIRNDVVVIYVETTGLKGGKTYKESYTKKILPYVGHTAIQISTAGSVCAIAEMLNNNQITTKGLVGPWDINYYDFIKTYWGRCYE